MCSGADGTLAEEPSPPRGPEHFFVVFEERKKVFEDFVFFSRFIFWNFDVVWPLASKESMWALNCILVVFPAKLLAKVFVYL